MQSPAFNVPQEVRDFRQRQEDAIPQVFLLIGRQVPQRNLPLHLGDGLKIFLVADEWVLELFLGRWEFPFGVATSSPQPHGSHRAKLFGNSYGTDWLAASAFAF